MTKPILRGPFSFILNVPGTHLVLRPFASNPPLAISTYVFKSAPSRVVWFGRTVEQRYKEIGNAVAAAAAAAIHCDELNLALEWLEQGRPIIWGRILRLRTALDNLRQQKLMDQRGFLARWSLQAPSKTQSSSAIGTPEEIAQVHRRLADEYEDAVKRIRSFPDFTEFLRPKKSASLRSAVVSGPVVIENADVSGCDPLVLCPHWFRVCHVTLPGLQASVAREMQFEIADAFIDTTSRMIRWSGQGKHRITR